MNRAQKNAWFGLGFSLVADGLMIFILALSCTRSVQTFPWIFGTTGLMALLFVLLLLISSICRKRQSSDIDADERDKVISNLAIKISFASVWPLLLLVSLCTVFLVGVEGPVPAILLIFIHVGVFVFVASIYFSSLLILYRLKGGAA